MKYVILLTCIILSGCAGMQIRECKNLCQSGKVELFKDESLTCKCQGGEDVE